MCSDTAFGEQLDNPDALRVPSAKAPSGAGSVQWGGSAAFAMLDRSENLMNSSHFLRMRERIETTSEILPSATNNYKGSSTSGFLGCL